MSYVNRKAQLEAKKQLTGEEMNELINLSSVGDFKQLPNALHLGVKNLEAFVTNMDKAAQISKEAFERGFFIEVLSLRLQAIEIFLRMFIVGKSKKGKTIDPDSDKRTFGNYIHECEQIGFNQTLIIELKEFNRHRVNAIHKFLLGETSYEELGEICISTTGLVKKVVDYVGPEVGLPI